MVKSTKHNSSHYQLEPSSNLETCSMPGVQTNMDSSPGKVLFLVRHDECSIHVLVYCVKYLLLK